MRRYNPKEIEPKWQKIWEDNKLYEVKEDNSKEKRYILEYFPYPSGAAMHVGHVRNYTIGDAVSRYARMKGYNVLHPMGWDAFGLPAENYAIKTGISPQQAIAENTSKFKQQLMQMGFGYDWSREITSSNPDYYKWTQWFFLLLYKRGLAYQQDSPQWWCPIDKTVLANEQVENGKCWRCGSIVEKKTLRQWFFKITEYADRLEKDLDKVDWSHALRTMQRNWIGHKTGIDITYKVGNVKGNEEITCFTTRPDTNFGATFVVLAPEHPFVQKVIDQGVVPSDGPSHWQAVQHYVQKSLSKTEIERQEEGHLKTGAFTGFYVVNELNKKKLPVWVSDFVLSGFGTGAVVGVPGHDARDFAFAKEFGIPIERVVVGADDDSSPITKADQVQEKAGKMINSEFLDGLDIHEATEKMKDYMEQHGMGKRVHSYHLRDWLISRQRYWGAPIPMIYCGKCGVVPVPEADLPVVLPELKSFEPSGDGRSPLANVPEFVNTTCPKCGGKAERETDTMDGFACSSWYMWRFADPHNDKEAFAADKLKYWAPVDDYIGGAEHAVMHLLYVRFWTKVMFDAAILPFDEPVISLRNQGMILAPDGQKMSKSKGNTIAPDEIIEQGYGADSIRVMELFIGPWDQRTNWSVDGMGGSFRFLQRIWTLVMEFKQSNSAEQMSPDNIRSLRQIINLTVKRVSEDMDSLGLNTAVASMMEAVNGMYLLKTKPGFSKDNSDWTFAIETLLKMLAPIAPHISEELWQETGHQGSIHVSQWPAYDDQYVKRVEVTVVVQINGKVRDRVNVPVGSDEKSVMELVYASEKVKANIDGKTIKKTVFVPDKLVSLVI